MEITVYHIDRADADVYLMPLLEAPKKRVSEEKTERYMLRHVFGADAELSHEADGRPLVENSSCMISLSHSKTHLAMAVSHKIKVGIDIESVSPRLDRVKHKFLSEDELRQLPSKDLTSLALCWSAKEAIYKVTGEKAGALGEHITLDVAHINNHRFGARIADEKFEVEVVEQNEDYEMVVAWKC